MGGSQNMKESIPNAIIFEILKELPAKSLMRFKCVCQQWRSIIQDPHFIDSHRIRSHDRQGGIKLLHRKKSSPEFSLLNPEGEGNLVPLQIPEQLDCGRYEDSMVNHEFFWFAYGKRTQQVEGLVCFGDFHIWNPSTRKSIELPPQNVTVNFLEGFGTYFVKYKCILGFDTSTKEYKVLSICCIFKNRWGLEPHVQVIAQVYTLGIGSWRKVECFPEELPKYFKIKKSCCISDVIYCILEYPIRDLLAFELGEEKFQILPLPDDFGGLGSSMEVQDRFALFQFTNINIKFWILEDFETRKWKQHYITFPVVWNVNYDAPVKRYDMKVQPVGSIHTGEVLFRAWTCYTGKSFWFYYDLESGKIRRVRKLSKRLAAFVTSDILSKCVETVFELS